ncbi:MAG TPA: nuclear transport factor 2 family protein [Solirubrobacteraceae bacterium]|nr:nuclear transport factor 2 family protein [Solirubrobacteraceae bacterium]
MSQENVSAVQAIYDGVLARGRLSDPATVGLLEKFFDPDVELQQMQGVIGTTGTFRGYEGLLNSARELLAAFEDFRIVPEQHFDEGDSVVTIARGRGTGRRSGVEVDMRVGHLWVLRAGRVLRWVVYATPDEALEAVGLRDVAPADRREN